MKKYLFFITTAFVTVSALNAQTIVKVGADTDVRVKESTLFYMGGNLKVAAYKDDSKKVLNEGNIRVTGNFTNANANGENFVNAISGVGKYGQLIITGTGENTGKITSQVKFDKKNFNFQTLAVPYKDITVQDLVEQAFKGTPSFVNSSPDGTFNENRYKNPVFSWNNEHYRLDNLTAGSKVHEYEGKINPAKYLTLSSFAGELKDGVVNLSGVPFSSEFDQTLFGYQIPGPKYSNAYGEAYGSYIIDFTWGFTPQSYKDFAEVGPTGKNPTFYGDYIYYFGNPYTSNINISKMIREKSNPANVHISLPNYITSVYQEASNNYNTDPTVAAAESFSNINVYTGNGTGDPAALYVRPFQTFAVKLKSLYPGQTTTINYTNTMKTFDIKEDANNVLYKKGQGNMPKVNQVGLDLYDATGNNTGNRAYVVASGIYEASQKGEGAEIYNVSMSEKDTGIYTLQESEDGSVDERFADSKTYINGVNADKYVGKPIHLVFQNGKGHYTIKARLNDDLLNNKNKFYFEDKATGKIVKINKDFEYSFDVQGTDKDRFVLYWAATSKADLDKEVAKEEVNNTVIYKDSASYKVRFDNSMKRADVFVYNISGQLINIVKGINTTEDYIVPIQGNASIYVVKIVGDNGKVITKKIIK